MSTHQTQHLFPAIMSLHYMLISSSEHEHNSCSHLYPLEKPGPRKHLVAPSAMTIQVDDFTGFTQFQLNYIIPASGMLRCSTARSQATGFPIPQRSPLLHRTQTPFHHVPRLVRTAHSAALPNPPGYSGQAPLAALSVNAHSHFGMGIAISTPIVWP